MVSPDDRLPAGFGSNKGLLTVWGNSPSLNPTASWSWRVKTMQKRNYPASLCTPGHARGTPVERMQLRESRPMSIQSWFYMPGITLLTRTPMSRPLKMEEVVERTLEYTKEGDHITIQPISANRVNRTDKLHPQTRKCGEIKRISLYFVYFLSVLVAFWHFPL